MIRKRTMPFALQAAFLLFIAAQPLFARDVEILLEDTELGLPLEGAVIRSWDGSQYTSDEDGKAVIEAPDDRQVVVQAAYPGYETGRLVIVPGTDQFTLGLRLSGIMENRELVIEAAKPGTSETKTGRSVAISGRDITQTAEIGIVEDVMTSVKLLPGVGYTGFFDSQPSIRGGDPGDMRASLDGYYIFSPYHWGGGFSIFDPRMVESAQLSHGVFSSRYGHTISGLLDITTKRPSPTQAEFEVGMNISAAYLNMSLPLLGKGGIMFMGRVTYYDPVVAYGKLLANFIEYYETMNMITVAPYIRSTTLTGNYRFLHNLELQATGFWGMDGVGIQFDNSSDEDGLKSDSAMVLNWDNYQGFITTGLSWNPRNDMLLKFNAGTGYHDMVSEINMTSNIHKKAFSETFKNNYGDLMKGLPGYNDPYEYDSKTELDESDLVFNAQGRLDYDWELGKGFLLSAGVQEMFNIFRINMDQLVDTESLYTELKEEDQRAIAAALPGLKENLLQSLWVSFPGRLNSKIENKLFTTSAYALTEYQTPGGRFGAELGLRMDHFYLVNKDFTVQSEPAWNPRLNLDFNVFKNKGIIESFDLSAGTGLFSSVNDMAALAEKKYGITEIKPNRSWTSVLGTKLAFIEGLNFNVEGYYKHIFDRMYIPVSVGFDGFEAQPKNNGEGQVWGIDVMIQKLQSRFWDGWISYSYNWARYRDPNAIDTQDWYFPDYHRFHNLNLVLNIRPTPRVNVFARFGLASGVQLMRRLGGAPESFPVYVYKDLDPSNSYFIEKYYWPEERDEDNRTTLSLPLDIKVSIFQENRTGKVRYEWYAALENILALLYTSQGNTIFNEFTGKVETGNMAASYGLPIPIPSFGFKLSY